MRFMNVVYILSAYGGFHLNSVHGFVRYIEVLKRVAYAIACTRGGPVRLSQVTSQNSPRRHHQSNPNLSTHDRFHLMCIHSLAILIINNQVQFSFNCCSLMRIFHLEQFFFIHSVETDRAGDLMDAFGSRV